MRNRRSTQHLLAAVIAASALPLAACSGAGTESRTEVLDPVVRADPTTPATDDPADGDAPTAADFAVDATLDPGAHDPAAAVEGPAVDAAGARLLTACGTPVPFPSSDAAEPEDRLSYSTSSVEGYDGRTIGVFPSVRRAKAAMVDVRVALEGCAQDDGGDGLTDRVFASFPSDVADESATFGWTYQEQDGVGAPAGELFTVARLGAAVLTIEWSGEGSAEHRAASVADQLALAALVLTPDAPPSSDDAPAHDPAGPLDADLDTSLSDMRGDGGDYVTTYHPAKRYERFTVELCGRTVWPVDHTDELLAYATGPEYADTRDLVRTRSVDEALGVLATLRTALADCHGEDQAVWTEHRVDTGYDSVTFTLSYKEGLGLSTFQATRVGDAVLLVVVYGEGTLEGAQWQIDDRTALTQEIASQL